MNEILLDLLAGFWVGVGASLTGVVVISIIRAHRHRLALKRYVGDWSILVFNSSDGTKLEEEPRDHGLVIRPECHKQGVLRSWTRRLYVECKHDSISSDGQESIRTWTGWLTLDAHNSDKAICTFSYQEQAADRAEFGYYHVLRESSSRLQFIPGEGIPSDVHPHIRDKRKNENAA